MMNSTAEFANKIVMVTGASRGVGASIAKMIAARGGDVIVNYRSKAARAEVVAGAIRAAGGHAYLAPADLCSEADVLAMIAEIKSSIDRVDILILNASGGLEKGVAQDYAMRLNRDAQLRLAELMLPLMPAGARVVFVTSHPAHFYGRYHSDYQGYAVVAASKHAGEQALRARMPAFAELGISLLVVSGDLIEGTITAKIMERMNKGMTEERRKDAGALPSVEDFSAAIVTAAANPQLLSGDTVYVGSID